MGPVIRFEGRPFRVYDGIPPRQGQRYDLRIAGTRIQQSIADASAEHQPCPKENSTSRGGRAILCSRMAETIRCRQSIPETNDLIRLDNYRHPLCGTCESQVVEYTGTPFCVETMALWHGENRRIHATQPGAVPAIRRYRNGPVSLSASRPHPCTQRTSASTPHDQVRYLRIAGSGIHRCPSLHQGHRLAPGEPLLHATRPGAVPANRRYWSWASGMACSGMFRQTPRAMGSCTSNPTPSTRRATSPRNAGSAPTTASDTSS